MPGPRSRMSRVVRDVSGWPGTFIFEDNDNATVTNSLFPRAVQEAPEDYSFLEEESQRSVMSHCTVLVSVALTL